MSVRVKLTDIYNAEDASTRENFNTAPRIIRTVRSGQKYSDKDERNTLNLQKIGYETLKNYGIYIVSIRGAGKTAYESYYILSRKENASHIPFGHILETQPSTLSIYMKMVSSNQAKFYLYRVRDNNKKELQSTLTRFISSV